MYYFAYGSNLNKEQMKKRCPNSKIFGSSFLFDHELLFRNYENVPPGYLTVQQKKNSQVPIGIYKISRSDECSLDKYEGVHTNCYRKELLILKANDENIEGLIYIMNNPQTYKPTDEYYNKIKIGYEEWGFDINYLFNACKECRYF
jgi:hypothetical protein